jgi:putative phosphoesterase
VTTNVLLVGDTHIRTWEQAHPELARLVRSADLALHAGDWTHLDTVAGFQAEAKRSVVVHGNSDPPELRQALPYREIVEVEELRIGLIHPSWGREEFPSERLLPDFKPEEVGRVDVICFGHFHVTLDEVVDGMRFVNGGQGYPSFLVPGTVAWLRVSGSELTVEFEEFAPGE